MLNVRRVVQVCRVKYSTGSSKEMLMKLRRQTNYSFVNCRLALEKFNYDYEQASKWLEEMAVRQGWQKAAKLSNRTAHQGLIGLLVDKTLATMIQVNCETDFVAKTSKFQQLVSSITTGCHRLVNGAEPKLTLSKKFSPDFELLNDVQIEMDDKSPRLNDALALSMSSFGEKISFTRWSCLTGGSGIHLAGYTHPKAQGASQILLGQYGAIVALSSGHNLNENLGSQLCQHIIGMKPLSIGLPEERDRGASKPDQDDHSNNKLANDEEDLDSQRTVLNDSTILLQQTFLLDPNVLVQNVLADNNAKVVDFVRFSVDDEEY